MSLFLLFTVFIFLSHSIEGVKELPKHVQQTLQDTEEYECVDIYKQPAFNNILLKNHKIQMDPSFLPSVKTNRELLFSSKIPSEGCPMGMVPIQRTQVDNLTDLNFISRLHLGNIQPLTNTAPGRHFAALYLMGGKTVHGAKAGISLYNPPVKTNQISMSQIWIENGPPAELNSIQVGWAVHPLIYGDNRTRATAYWTADGSQKTGCYNTICPGFVQVHPKYHLGQAYGATSVIGGEQYITQLLVYLDKESGNWWLVFDNGIKVGYWPKELFTHLKEGATYIQYGGWTYNSPDGVSPPMGNGHFPDKNFKSSSFVSQMQIVDTFDRLADIDGYFVGNIVDNTNCYNKLFWGDQGSVMGQCMTFGGPGGKCGT